MDACKQEPKRTTNEIVTGHIWSKSRNDIKFKRKSAFSLTKRNINSIRMTKKKEN